MLHTYSLVIPLVEGKPVIKGYHLQRGQTGHIISQATFCEVSSDKGKGGISA